MRDVRCYVVGCVVLVVVVLLCFVVLCCCCCFGLVPVAFCWLVVVLRWLRWLSNCFVDLVGLIVCCWLCVLCLFVVCLRVRGCSCACSAGVR